VEHGEAVRRLGEVKEELERVRAGVREYQTKEEVAVANLASSEASFARQKTTLEQEISDLKNR
jgi:hypothetical protein